MTRRQIQLVAKYITRDYEPNSMADCVSQAFIKVLLPNEIEYYNIDMIESALNMLLEQKGAIED